MPKTKKIAKKIKSEKSKKYVREEERHFGIVLEDINSKMTLVLEGHLSLDKKIDDFKGEFVEFKEETSAKFEVVGEKFDKIDQRFDGIDQRFDSVGKRFSSIDQRFDKMDKRFDGIDQRFDSVGKRFSSIDQRFDKMDKRFDGMNQRFDGIDKKIEKISGDNDGLKNDMVFVKYKLSAIENSLKQKVDIEQFEQLEQRVIRLEGLAVKQ